MQSLSKCLYRLRLSELSNQTYYEISRNTDCLKLTVDYLQTVGLQYSQSKDTV